jgi:hypothetical protein
MRRFFLTVVLIQSLYVGLGSHTSLAAFEPTIATVTVNPDGWTITVTIDNAVASGTFSGLNNPTSPGLAFDIISPAFDATGVTTTINRTIYATALKRKPYPNQTKREETVASTSVNNILTLSEYIYVNDIINAVHVAPNFFIDAGTGGTALGNLTHITTATNSSIEKYPLPQAVWLGHDLETATSSSYEPRLVVMHRFGRAGQPVRAVTFIATDEHGLTTSAATQSLSAGGYASGHFANYFTAPLDFSTLTAGDLVSIDAIIYPWLGDRFQISLQGATHPSPNLTLLKVFNDTNQSYGTVYAYVDGLGAGLKAVSTNPNSAITTPYPTIAAAATAIQTYNNTNFGRNNVSGGVIRITASTTITGLGTDTMDTVIADGKIPLIIEGVDRQSSIYTNTTSGSNNDIPGLLKMRNLTFKKSGASVTGFDGKNLLSNLLVFEDVTFDGNNQSSYAGWLIQFGRGYFINTTGNYVKQGDTFASYLQSTVLTLGSTFFPQTVYNVIASRGQGLAQVAPSPLGTPKGSIFAWNFGSIANGSGNLAHIGSMKLGPQGTALVGNIFEQYASTTVQSNVHISADANVVANENLIDYGNTVVGERSNLFYQDKGTTTIVKKGLTKHSVHWRRNTKSDIFGLNSNLVGNWAIRYGVGSGYSLVIDGDSSGKKVPGANAWLGEIIAIGEKFFGNPRFINDQSTRGGKQGNGNYAPGISSDIPFIPAGETYFITDLFGTPIATDGTARAGAVQ